MFSRQKPHLNPEKSALLTEKKDLSGPGRRNRLFFVAAALLFLGYMFLVNPAGAPLPECRFHSLTGLPCPTCGMTHSMHAFLHLQWAPSFSFHWMGPVLGLLLIFLMLKFSVELVTGRVYRILLFRYQGWFFWGLLLLVWLSYWFSRLFQG